MVDPSRAASTLNGEIYNYLELRAELETLGHTFISDRGTAKSCCEAGCSGASMPLALNGMWAIALYDEPAGRLLLSRDRFGEKPLHWITWRGGVAYASEVKQLVRFPGLEPHVDLTAARQFLASARPHLGGASSWFRNVQQAEPGGLAHGRSRRDGSDWSLLRSPDGRWPRWRAPITRSSGAIASAMGSFHR